MRHGRQWRTRFCTIKEEGCVCCVGISSFGCVWIYVKMGLCWVFCRQYKYEEFENMANQVFVENYSSLACLSCKMFEREFWQEMAWGIHHSVEYGVDVEGSAFSKSDELGQSKWNLKVSCSS